MLKIMIFMILKKQPSKIKKEFMIIMGILNSIVLKKKIEIKIILVLLIFLEFKILMIL